jgi:hypothetical protein
MQRTSSEWLAHGRGGCEHAMPPAWQFEDARDHALRLGASGRGILAGFEPATHGVEKRETQGIFPQFLKALVDVAAPVRGFFRDDTEKTPPRQRRAVAK